MAEATIGGVNATNEQKLFIIPKDTTELEVEPVVLSHLQYHANVFQGYCERGEALFVDSEIQNEGRCTHLKNAVHGIPFLGWHWLEHVGVVLIYSYSWCGDNFFDPVG